MRNSQLGHPTTGLGLALNHAPSLGLDPSKHLSWAPHRLRSGSLSVSAPSETTTSSLRCGACAAARNRQMNSQYARAYLEPLGSGCLAVSSITGVELGTAADEVEAGLGHQVVEKRKLKSLGTEDTSWAPIATSRGVRWWSNIPLEATGRTGSGAPLFC
ncbi:hypothetical protein ACFX13_028815 [Malus domestica]